jgi:pimeloyl-ACP methyl ester carboxylesterase
MPAGDTSFLAIAKALYPDRFFYQLYFQAQGVAEAELERDIPTALRKIYFSLSGDARAEGWLKQKPADAALLDGLADPDPFPDWLSTEDLEVYAAAFADSGFRGPLNRYRAQDLDVAESVPVRGRLVEQPACFIGGEHDAVRRFIPGVDLYADPGAACSDFREATIIPGAGHWVQQEAPAPTNAALERFLDGL